MFELSAVVHQIHEELQKRVGLGTGGETGASSGRMSELIGILERQVWARISRVRDSQDTRRPAQKSMAHLQIRDQGDSAPQLRAFACRPVDYLAAAGSFARSGARRNGIGPRLFRILLRDHHDSHGWIECRPTRGSRPRPCVAVLRAERSARRSRDAQLRAAPAFAGGVSGAVRAASSDAEREFMEFAGMSCKTRCSIRPWLRWAFSAEVRRHVAGRVAGSAEEGRAAHGADDARRNRRPEVGQPVQALRARPRASVRRRPVVAR